MRVLTTDMLAALNAPIVNPAIFVALTFGTKVSGLIVPTVVRLWSGIGTTTFNSQSWLGMGAFMGVSAPEDSSTVEAKGLTVTLSGIDAALLPAVLNSVYLGLPVTVYLALYDSTNTVIDIPVVAWAGRMDQPSFEVSAETVVIGLNCETRMFDLNVPVDRRYTNEDTQRDNPGDLGCMFVDGLQENTIYWGQYPTTGVTV